MVIKSNATLFSQQNGGDEKYVQHNLNDAARQLVNNCLKNETSYAPCKLFLDQPSSEVSVLHKGSTLTSNLPKNIKSEIFKISLITNICKAEEK